MAEIPIGRTMPFSAEAEQAVLGSMIFDVSALNTVMEELCEEDFYTTPHKIIFSAINNLYTLGVPVDLVTLSEKIGDKIESIGGIGYLSKIVQGVLTTENLRHYIRIVKTKSVLRKLIDAAGEIIDISTKDEDKIEVVLDRSEQLIFSILEDRTDGGLVPIGEVIKSALKTLEELRSKGGTVKGVPTGFTQLDNLTAGLQNSDLIVIAARPGVGKTSFALNIATHAAISNKTPVAIFSLEMSREQVVNRIMSSEALIDAQKMKTGSLDAEDKTSLAHALNSLVPAPIYIDDNSAVTVSEIRAKCRRLKLEKGLGLVVVDYLQLMQGSGKTDNRAKEVADMSRSLKIMAKELNVPVITLSQLNRASTQGKKGQRPQLSELRESGSIEQDADIVMLLYNPDMAGDNDDDEQAKRNVVECIIAKHRAGECKTIEFAWRGEYTKFTNLDTRS